MNIIQSDILNGYSSVEIFQCIKMWLNQRIIKQKSYKSAKIKLIDDLEKYKSCR